MDNKANDALRFELINYNNLFLDNLSPRVPQNYRNKAEKDIIDFLLLESSTLELMQAIGENDFFQGEQLLVVNIGGEKFKVVEGNRRLASVKLLNNPELASAKTASVKQIYDEAKYHPTEIPCLIFKNENDIRRNLGFKQITGIKPWGLSEKARYLYHLYEELFKSGTIDVASQELAKIIGSRKEYVKRVLISYKLYKKVEDEHFYNIRDLDDTTFYVGYLVDSLSRANITTFLGIELNSESPLNALNAANLKSLIHWFFEKNSNNKTILKGKSEDLNMLNAVLGKNISFEAFLKEQDIERAFELTDDLETLFITDIQKSLQYIEHADSIIHKIDHYYQGLEEDLIQIRKLTSKIKQVKDGLKSGEFGGKDGF